MIQEEPLHYSIGDEDNRLEWSLLRRRAHHVVAAAGSGARLLPLLARRPQRLTALDLSPVQLALTRLRIAALSEWTHEEYCAFFGYPPHAMSPEQRRSLFDYLPLDANTRALLRPQFEANGWTEVAYYGHFEQSLIATSRLVRVMLGPARRCLFEAQGIEDQRRILREEFPWRRWQMVLALICEDDELRDCLSHGAFAEPELREQAYAHFDRLFRHLFHNTLIRESFFLQLLVLGRIEYPEGLPTEAHPLIFEAARDALCETELSIVEGDLIEWLACHDGVDFVSMCDVSAVLDPEREASFLDDIHGSLLPGSRVITRRHAPVGQSHAAGYHLAVDDHRSVLEAESTQLWEVAVYDRELAA